MTKISPLKPIQTKAMETSKTVVKQVAKDTANAAKSVLDLSTEELGYFMINGRCVKTIFPR